MERDWGYWDVLLEGDGYKVKQIVVNPMSKLSYQRHQHRTEYWVIVSGEATIVGEGITRTTDSSYYIGKTCWHQLINNTRKPLKIVEVSTGKIINEEDIERKDV